MSGAAERAMWRSLLQDELSSLMETAYLLRSPKNAERLFDSMRELEAGGGEVMSLDELRRSVGLDAASDLDKAS